MADTYTRQSSFTDGDVIRAEHGNDEFNQLVRAFHEITGHNHDGTVAGGAAVPMLKDITGAQDFNLSSTGVSGSVIKDEDNMVSNSSEHLVTQQSVKAYADNVLVNANAYADTNLATAQAYADQAEVDAKAYTDAREVVIKAYADQAEADAKSYSDLQLSSSIINSSTGSSTTAAMSQSSVKLYVDQAEADAKSYADANSTSDRAYTDSKVSALLIDEDTFVSDSVTHAPTQQSTKAYVDTQVGNAIGGGGEGLLNIDNSWAGINTYSQPPRSTIDPSVANDLTRKSYVDSKSTADRAYTDQAEVDAKAYTDAREVVIKAYADQAEADAKSYADTKSTSDRAYADSAVAAHIIDEDSFASNSATLPPSQQSTKVYVDSEVAAAVAAGSTNLLGSANTWTGTNSFSSTVNVPTPTATTHVARKDYVDTQVATKVPTTRSVIAGSGLSGGGQLSGNVTLTHANTSSVASINGSGGTVVQDIGFDTYGHATSAGTVNLDTRFVRFTNANGYDGLNVNGNATAYIRTPSNGLLPYAPNTTSGSGNIGTSSWPFATIHAKTFTGNLIGNVTGNVTGTSSGVSLNSSTSTSYYPVPFHSSNKLYKPSTTVLEMQPSTGNLRTPGNVQGYYTSDENLKDEIKEIENPVSKLKTLRACTYNKLDRGSGETHFETGLIAQDVQKVIPELVHENNYGDLTIRQGGNELIALLVAAVKEQTKRIEALEAKVGED